MTATAHTATLDRAATGITIRVVAADIPELAELALLDSAAPLQLPAVAAFSEERLLAALSLVDGRVTADPFHPTLGLVELLRIRARQIASGQAHGAMVNGYGWQRFARLRAGWKTNASPLRSRAAG